MVVRVYVGDLGDQGSRSELERVFSRYGRITEAWVARNPPGFAFVFFEDYHEAENACAALDGKTVCGVRIRAEIAKGPEKGQKQRNGPKCYECGRIGHTTRECTRRPGYVYRGKNSYFQKRQDRYRRSRSRSRSRDRSYRRRRSRSYSPRDNGRDRHRSRSGERQRYRSPSPYDRKRRDSRSQGRDRRGDGDYREEQYNDDV